MAKTIMDIYVKVKVSGRPTEMDSVGCDGLFIEGTETCTKEINQLEAENAKLLQAVNDKDLEPFEAQELVGELLEALEAFVKVHHDDNVDICRDAGVSPSGCDCAECIRGEKAIRNAKEK